ncbi:serine hydrolase [Streptomyces sp. NPDC051211]|uniref:serine hydrolase n=1 Tax=Streptomyces sp. NPDC051211 TaxID=3154643 RepID=UPI00344E0AC5
MTSAMTSDARIPVPPGSAWAVGDCDGIRDRGPRGDGGPALDAGGLAAVLAVWPVLGTLVEEGALRLHTPLTAYGPTLGRSTAHQILTRTGDHELLARLAEQVTGRPLADLAAERIWRPLAMTRTAFAPTLHTVLEDTAAFLRHLLVPGPLSPAWIADSLRIRTGELAPDRGLLWRPAPGTDRRQDIWVHHATPGPTALWISPRHRRWAALLTPPAPHAPPHTGLRDAFRAFAFDPA